MDKTADKLKPGEYIGEGGRTYRWVKLCDDHIRHQIHTGKEWLDCPDQKPADWPEAKAALDALIESKQGERIPLGTPFSTPHTLVLRDKPWESWVEYGECGRYRPTDDVSVLAAAGFRAGLAQGEKNNAEQGQKLVEAVRLYCDKLARDGCANVIPMRDAAEALAKKVKL